MKDAQKAGLEFPRVSPHDLRHTAASLAISAGANLKAVQRMLGHAPAIMTLDTYADLFDDDLDGVVVALNAQAMISNVGKMWAGIPRKWATGPKNLYFQAFLPRATLCPHRDSNPDWNDFKSSASADWAMGARSGRG